MRIFIRLVLLSVLILGACLSFHPTQAMGQLPFFGNSLMGKTAPDFTLKSLKGETVNFSKAREGQRAIIFFWATWCPHCRTALKELNDDYDNIQKKNIKLFLVDLGEDARDVGAYATARNIKADILLDETSSLSQEYSIIGVPTFVFVDEKGIVTTVEHAFPSNYDELFSAE